MILRTMNVIDALLRLKVNLCDNERCVQRYLASLLGADVNVIINGYEVDVYGVGLAIEVKVNPRPYDGVGQAIALKRVLGISNVWLIHVFLRGYVDLSKHCGDLNLMLKGLDINYAVVSNDGLCLNGVLLK